MMSPILRFDGPRPSRPTILMIGTLDAEACSCRAIVPGASARNGWGGDEPPPGWLQEGGIMALRIILMGLVASMGFELPGGLEVSAWAGPTPDQVCARQCIPSGPTVEADRPDVGPTDCL